MSFSSFHKDATINLTPEQRSMIRRVMDTSGASIEILTDRWPGKTFLSQIHDLLGKGYLTDTGFGFLKATREGMTALHLPNTRR